VFIAFNVENRRKASRNAFSWLSNQIEVLQKEVEESERAVLEYLSEHDIDSLVRRQTLLEEQIATLTSELHAAQGRTRELDIQLAEVNRLQADPERPGTNLMVHIGKPRDDKWVDTPVGNRYVRSGSTVVGYEQGDEFAIGEVGGGRTWLRRFTVEGSVFVTRSKDDRDLANETANTIRGLVESYLTPDIVLGIEDDFGERAYRLILGQSTAEERGGPKSHIWDLWVYFSVETVRPH